MGSRMMHSIIGLRIAEELDITDDLSLFLLGNIAPDAVNGFEAKNQSHFFVGEVEDHTRRVDFNGFIKKYERYLNDNQLYILGYYTHLIADDIWLRGFNLPWLKNRMNADEKLYEKYHEDFRMLNGKLLSHYDYSEEIHSELNKCQQIRDLEEVKGQNVQEFVHYVLGDIEYEHEKLSENLNVFTLNQILGYIETSVDLGLFKLKSLKSF